MSGYFDALLRSGGMAAAPQIQPTAPESGLEAVGGMAAAPPIQPTAPESGLEAVGEEPAMPVPAGERQPPALAAGLTERTQPATPTQTPAAPLAPPIRLPSAPHPAPASIAASTSAVGEPPHEAGAPRPAPEQSPAPPAVRAAAAAEPGRALIQAALDWVAAGPQDASDTGPAHPAPLRAGQEQPAPVPAGPRRAEGISPPAAASADVLQGALHDETVEISIGTIQVRVDAPAVQAAAAPAVPAPPAGISGPTRGALARRSLRRF
ncbi:hypothetical protein [Massilia sp. METH4]|uniref:hypothetical protein n=1 Tax=Massilia sp. METH4 TaxID=3123041 RepID=UPI0030D0FDD3